MNGMGKKEFPNPWRKKALKSSYTPEELDYVWKYSLKWPHFHSFFENNELDIRTKLASLKASPSLVSVVSYSGDDELFHCSGIIIESDTILTSATVIRSRTAIRSHTANVAIAENIKVVVYLSNGGSLNGEVAVYDFHYNLAIVTVKSDTPLSSAVLRRIDDSFSVALVKESSFQLRPHSDSFNLIPGKKVIALGRYFTKPYHLMAASGEFSLDRCNYECKELFRVNCRITECGIGGPIINYDAEVVGITFYDPHFTLFLPINIVIKWWDHYKKYRVSRPPLLNMEVTNLYAAQLHFLEKVVQNFPGVFKGAIVEQVKPGSSADVAGICPYDVIVQCCGQNVRSFLELFEILWDKVGEPVEVVVVRVGHDGPLHLSMLLVGVEPDQFYGWPFLKILSEE